MKKKDRIKRMSMFGLRIETRDAFDENDYEDFQNTRREIKDKTQSYRVGPAPIADYQAKPKFHLVSSPGRLDSDLDEMEDETFSMSNLKTVNGSRAGCRGLIMYFSKIGHADGDQNIDLEFVDSLLRGGKPFFKLVKYLVVHCGFNCYQIIASYFFGSRFVSKRYVLKSPQRLTS